MQTGLPTQSTLYSAHETARAFSCQLGEDGGDGALLLLPHSCGVQVGWVVSGRASCCRRCS